MKKRSVSMALTALLPLIYLILAVAIIAVLCTNGTYPSGGQAMFHLYRGDTVYRSLQQGILYPYYDPFWFNGTELLRFTPPLTAYALALCQALAGGSVFYGYLLFVGLVFYAGAMGWYRIGAKMGRTALGAAYGILWFFLPYNLYVFFVEGDLARALAAALLPYLFQQVLRCLQSWRWTGILHIAICVCLMTLTHAAFALMVALCVLVLALVHSFLTHTFRGLGNLALALLSGFLLAGLWLAPYLFSGILNLDYSDAMASSFQTLAQSLNPIQNFNMQGSAPYFGLALFIMASFGGLFGRRKAATGAWTGIILLLLTTSVSYVVLHIIPGSQYLKLLWVFPAAAAAVFFSILYWDTLHRPLLVILCLLLVVDICPALSLVTGGGQVGLPADERMDADISGTLLDQAQALTTHRLAILDEGNLGCEGVFLATSWGTPVPVTGGDDRSHAATRSRLIQLSRAITGGQYLYVFDRCLELGCDTVLIQGGVAKWEDLKAGVVDAAAQRLGYTLEGVKGGFYLYHAELGSSWGLVSQYSAIGIGSTAHYMSLFYPDMEETTDTNLNHYTFEQLSQYQLVYLSGFTYDDRGRAEDLVLSLSEAGVHIVIEGDGIPESRQTRDRQFLGVNCNDIEFSYGYPEMDTIDGVLNTDLFPQGYTKWETIYTEGLDEVWGTIFDNGLTLPFYGTVHNQDIVVTGLNLGYYYFLTKDSSIGKLFERTMDLSTERLPDRTVVPLEIEYTAHGMELTAWTDEVNTTMAWHDFFSSQSPMENSNQLLQIGAGTTVVSLDYPYLVPGLITSLLGLIVLCAITLNCWRTVRLERAGEKLPKDAGKEESERGDESKDQSESDHDGEGQQNSESGDRDYEQEKI